MHTVTKYVAYDGTEFNVKTACIAHEHLCANVDAIMSALPERPDDEDCRFSNGHGYLQHNLVTLNATRIALLKLAQPYAPDPPWIQQTIDGLVHPSWAGRLINDACPRPIYKAWRRFMCIDAQNREWGQPYYANNPDNAPSKEPVCPKPAVPEQAV